MKRKFTILYLDDQLLEKDDPVINDIESLGYTVLYEQSSDLALKILEQNILSIDLFFIDEELSQTTSIKYKSGSQLGLMVNTTYSYIPTVMVTAPFAKDIQKCIEVLAEFDFSYFLNKGYFISNKEKSFNKITSLLSVKNKWKNRSQLIETKLKGYFTNLSIPERNELLKEANLNEEADWTKHPINIDGGTYALDQLLTSPNKEYSLNQLSEKVLEFLSSTHTGFQFGGNWSDPESDERKQLEKYFSQEKQEYYKEKNEIDEAAFNYLINVIFIKNQMKFDEDGKYDEKIIYLNKTNSAIKATENCKDTESGYLSFKNKLICRRVALGFATHTKFKHEKNEFLLKNHLAALLKRGSTDTSKTIRKGDEKGKKTDFKPSAVFSSNLGLINKDKRKNSIFIIDGNYIMDEEREWLNSFGFHADKMYEALNDRSLKNLNFNKSYDKELRPFRDLNEFKDYVKELKELAAKSPEKYEKIKKDIQEHSVRYPEFAAQQLTNWL